MSRVTVNDDGTEWDYIRWAGASKKAINGKRGQAFLKELRQALLELPKRRLIGGAFKCDGEVCALGAVAKKRKMDFEDLGKLFVDADTGFEQTPDPEEVGKRFQITKTLAWEIMYWNDEWAYYKSPEDRFERVLRWVEDNLTGGKNGTS